MKEECPYCHKQAEVGWIKFTNKSKIKLILCECIPSGSIFFMNEPSITTIDSMKVMEE